MFGKTLAILELYLAGIGAVGQGRRARSSKIYAVHGHSQTNIRS
jgi:hypothetical protein